VTVTLDTDEERINVPCLQTYSWKEKLAVLMLPRFQGSLQRTKTLILKPGKPPVLCEYRYCGQSQEKATAMKCLAFGKVCNNCKKENHFAAKCAAEKNHRKKKTNIGRKSRGKFVNQLKESKDKILLVSHTQEKVNIFTLVLQSKVLTTMNVADKLIKMLIDSGAPLKVLPIKFLSEGSNLRSQNRKW